MFDLRAWLRGRGRGKEEGQKEGEWGGGEEEGQKGEGVGWGGGIEERCVDDSLLGFHAFSSYPLFGKPR